jgi:hypothetical protein
VDASGAYICHRSLEAVFSIRYEFPFFRIARVRERAGIGSTVRGPVRLSLLDSRSRRKIQGAAQGNP